MVQIGRSEINNKMPDSIAEIELVFINAKGDAVQSRITVERPIPHENNYSYFCKVDIGSMEPSVNIVGMDSLQALSFALAHLRNRLVTHRDKFHWKIYFPATGTGLPQGDVELAFSIEDHFPF